MALVRQHREGPPQEIPKGQVIGNDDPFVPAARGGEFLSQLHEVSDIEGQDGPALLDGEGQLVGVRKAPMAGLLGGKAILTPVTEHLG